MRKRRHKKKQYNIYYSYAKIKIYSKGRRFVNHIFIACPKA
jgi:hypothetical protein